MKIIIQDNRRFVLRFDKGDDVIAGVAQFMGEQAITACVFSGIGACSELELAYYNTHLKDYRKKPYVEDLEIVSLNGNGSIKDGQPFVHCHAIFSRNDFSALAGHALKIIVSATCEVFVIKLEGEMNRELNSDWNLSLLV